MLILALLRFCTYACVGVVKKKENCIYRVASDRYFAYTCLSQRHNLRWVSALISVSVIAWTLLTLIKILHFCCFVHTLVLVLWKKNMIILCLVLRQTYIYLWNNNWDSVIGSQWAAVLMSVIGFVLLTVINAEMVGRSHYALERKPLCNYW